MVRVELGGGYPSKITLYILKNNYTKFGAFVRFVPISSKLTIKQPDYTFFNWTDEQYHSQYSESGLIDK